LAYGQCMSLCFVPGCRTLRVTIVSSRASGMPCLIIRRPCPMIATVGFVCVCEVWRKNVGLRREEVAAVTFLGALGTIGVSSKWLQGWSRRPRASPTSSSQREAASHTTQNFSKTPAVPPTRTLKNSHIARTLIPTLSRISASRPASTNHTNPNENDLITAYL
jgi:hypothetical protein